MQAINCHNIVVVAKLVIITNWKTSASSVNHVLPVLGRCPSCRIMASTTAVVTSLPKKLRWLVSWVDLVDLEFFGTVASIGFGFNLKYLRDPLCQE